MHLHWPLFYLRLICQSWTDHIYALWPWELAGVLKYKGIKIMVFENVSSVFVACPLAVEKWKWELREESFTGRVSKGNVSPTSAVNICTASEGGHLTFYFHYICYFCMCTECPNLHEYFDICVFTCVITLCIAEI